jgi:hypothetical protein
MREFYESIRNTSNERKRGRGSWFGWNWLIKMALPTDVLVK